MSGPRRAREIVTGAGVTTAEPQALESDRREQARVRDLGREPLEPARVQLVDPQWIGRQAEQERIEIREGQPGQAPRPTLGRRAISVGRGVRPGARRRWRPAPPGCAPSTPSRVRAAPAPRGGLSPAGRAARTTDTPRSPRVGPGASMDVAGSDAGAAAADTVAIPSKSGSPSSAALSGRGARALVSATGLRAFISIPSTLRQGKHDARESTDRPSRGAHEEDVRPQRLAPVRPPPPVIDDDGAGSPSGSGLSARIDPPPLARAARALAFSLCGARATAGRAGPWPRRAGRCRRRSTAPRRVRR